MKGRVRMRLVFAGTPEFAQSALAALHDAGHQIALVLTQPDRPAGRGLKLQASPVKQWALAHGVPVVQPRSLRLEGKYPQEAAAARQATAAASNAAAARMQSGGVSMSPYRGKSGGKPPFSDVKGSGMSVSAGPWGAWVNFNVGNF